MPTPRQQTSKNTSQGADALMALARLLARQAAREAVAASGSGSDTSPPAKQNKE